VAGADVVMCFIGFEVLVVVVELNVAGGDRFEGPAVVFDVVGAKTHVHIVNINVTVAEVTSAAAALCFCFPDRRCRSSKKEDEFAEHGERCGRLCKGDKQRNQENQGTER